MWYEGCIGVHSSIFHFCVKVYLPNPSPDGQLRMIHAGKTLTQEI